MPGVDGQSTQLPNEIDVGPLNRPDWNYNMAAGREQLTNYHWALVAGLKGAMRHPTNLAKVREELQGPVEPPSVFLEGFMEAYRQYTPFDPSSEGQQWLCPSSGSQYQILRKVTALRRVARLYLTGLDERSRESVSQEGDRGGERERKEGG